MSDKDKTPAIPPPAPPPTWCSRCGKWVKDYGSDLCKHCRKDDYT